MLVANAAQGLVGLQGGTTSFRGLMSGEKIALPRTRDVGDVYEYICVYVDDLYAIMKDPDDFFNRLQDPNIHGYKLKGLIGKPTYHLQMISILVKTRMEHSGKEAQCTSKK